MAVKNLKRSGMLARVLPNRKPTLYLLPQNIGRSLASPLVGLFISRQWSVHWLTIDL